MATVRIQLRRGTAAEWSAVNPVLAAGEMGLETDTGDFKFGDGSTAWSGLSYSLGNAIDDYIPLSEKGVADGVATLDSNGFIPVAQLPGSAALDAEVNSAISTHNSDTTNVHGIANTAELETQTGAQAKADNAQGAAIAAAASDATSKANTAQSNAEATAAAALSAHESDTTGIHGIADTSILVTTTGTQTLTSKSLTSPALTGTPTAPTATAGTDTTQIATTAFVQDAIEAVVGAAPAALNTLAEIATSLNDDADLAGTLTASISEKVAKAGDTMTGALNMGNNKVTNLSSPTVNTDAANKSYVDSQIQSEGSSLLQSHAAVSNNVHGITNAADLVYTQDSRLSDERTPSDNSVTEGKIADDAVTTNKIADGAVSTGKIADIAINTAKLADGSVATAKIADGAVTAAKISDGAVSTAKISDESVTSAKLASSAVSTDKIAGLAVTTAKINDLAVTTAKIADSNITEAKINTGAVTADKIGAGAVTELKIADGSVTSAKIANGTIANEDISTTAAIAQSKIADLTTDLAAKAPLAGPTFTGTVVLPSTTSIGNVSATEIGYVDGVTSAIQTQLDSKLASSTASSTYAPIASPTFTGTVSGISKSMVGLGNVDNTSDANKPVSTATQTALDAKLSLAGGTMTGALTLSGAPTQDAHAATKAYVDNVSAGINFHQPVRVATTGNITLSGTQTIDGVSLSVGDRVLVKDQTTQTQNGIYVVASGAWTRATDADNTPNGELAGGDFTLVLEGTINSGYGYVCSNTSAITIGTTNVTYVAFNAAKAVTAGTGLTETTPGTLAVDSSTVQLRVSNVSDTEIGYLDGVTSAIQTQLDAKSPTSSPTFTGTVTVGASGIAFTDKTQTKAGVPSLTPILSAVGANTTLDALGTDAAVRDSLVPISGAFNVSFEATGNAKYAIGSSITFYQSAGTGGNITGNGVTILSTPGSTLRTTYSSVTATKVAASTWLLAGDLKA